MAVPIIFPVPGSIARLVQDNIIERSFHDALFPKLMYRSEALWEEWEEHTGTSIVITRRGNLAPNTRPLSPGVDPTPQQRVFEQWFANLETLGDTIDVHVPTSAVASSDLFLSDIKQLGMQAGQSMNRYFRNSLFKAYLSGHTAVITAGAAIDLTLRVASLNGFRDVVLPLTTVRPVAVSATTPLSITIANAPNIARGVVAVMPDDPADPDGPGTLFLDAALGAVVALRTPVLSSQRPRIIRAGGGLSVDAIGAGDIITLQDITAAVGVLRKANVMPHEDGFYHAHWPVEGNTQIFADTPFQRLNTGLPGFSIYQDAWIGKLLACDHVQNNENPDVDNSGATTATGTNALYSSDIGAETVNNTAVNIGRVIITGRGAQYEKQLDQSKHYVTEAGLTGKQAEFQVTNAGVAIDTKGIRLIIRAPINRVQDQVALTWSCTTSAIVPSDVASSGPSGAGPRYKRGVVIEFARD